MAQHDYVIANQGFPAFRSDLNNALAAIVSNNSGATEPTTMFAHQMWVDTAADPSVLKIRNADNDAWITIGTINQTADTFKLTPAGGISTDTISELTSAAGVTIDGVLLKDGGASVSTLNTSGAVVFNDAGANVDFRVEGQNNANLLFVDASSDAVLIGVNSLVTINSAIAQFSKGLVSNSNSNAVADQNAVVSIGGSIGPTNTEAASSLLCLTGNSGFATTPGRLIKGYGGNGATTHCFEVQHDGDVLNTNNSYGSISDERAKQDITDALSSWDDIKNIRVRKYRLKSTVEEYANNPNLGDAPYHIGVISQEVESVSPGLIRQDLLDDGTPDPDAMKHVKYSVLYMKAVKALQEAMERIETLEAKVAALENA